MTSMSVRAVPEGRREPNSHLRTVPTAVPINELECARGVAASGGALGSERYCACAFSAANSASLRKVMTPIWLDR